MDYENLPAGDAEPAALPRVYVYDRASDARYQELVTLYRWWEGSQHDYCYADFQGRARASGIGYIGDRQRDKGMVLPTELVRIGYDSRRPNAPAGLARRVVSRFTELTTGLAPTLLCPSDDNTAAYLTAVFEESCTFDAHQEARDYAGGTGSAVMIASVTDGQPNCETLPPFAVFVRRWANRKRWVPAEVVHQYRVEVTPDDDGPAAATELRIRTRMWTETEYVEFADVKQDHDKRQPLVVKERVPHKAGRCPVVWVQNTRRTSSPEGEYDLLNQQNLEMCDEVDRVQSHSLKATKANTQPTVVRADDPMSFAQQFPRLAKGVGHEIRVGIGGSATYLETRGDSVKMGWDSADRMQSIVLKNVNCWMPESETITSAPSGVAVAKLRRGMETRGNRIRTAQTWTIRQLAQIWINLGIGWGVTSEDEPGEGIILPPRLFKAEPQEPVVELPEEDEGPVPPAKPRPALKETLGPHKVGKGRSVRVVWPAFDLPTPTDMKDLAMALDTVTAAKLLSRQTGTEIYVAASGLRDAEQEHRRIAEEKEQNSVMLGPLLNAPVSGAAKAAEDGAAASEPRGGDDQEPDVDGVGDIG